MKDIRDIIKKTIKIVKGWIVGSIVFGLMLIIWLEAYIIISQTKVYTIIPRVKDGLGDYDLPALLFAAASLAFFAISFFMVILSFIGWSEIQKKIKATAESAFTNRYNEFTGWIKFSIGLLFGAMAIENSESEITVKNSEYLDIAIGYCKDALPLITDSDSKLYTATMNNYLFFVALGGKPSHGPVAKKYALELRKRPEAIGDTEVQNTYAKAVATYSEYFDSPVKAILDAKKMLDTILASESVTELDKKNARRHVAALDRALKLHESEALRLRQPPRAS